MYSGTCACEQVHLVMYVYAHVHVSKCLCVLRYGHVHEAARKKTTLGVIQRAPSTYLETRSLVGLELTLA